MFTGLLVVVIGFMFGLIVLLTAYAGGGLAEPFDEWCWFIWTGYGFTVLGIMYFRLTGNYPDGRKGLAGLKTAPTTFKS
jgi:4-hydroxybenzoate polyprenyltransferase